MKLERSKEYWMKKAEAEPDLPIAAGVPAMVEDDVYLSAVKGRQDFREAFRQEREASKRLRLFVEALAIGDPLAMSDVRGYALHALTGEPYPSPLSREIDEQSYADLAASGGLAATP